MYKTTFLIKKSFFIKTRFQKKIHFTRFFSNKIIKQILLKKFKKLTNEKTEK